MFGLRFPATLLLLATPLLAQANNSSVILSQRTVAGAFWRTDGDFRSTLSLSNQNQIESAVATPVMVTAQGHSIELAEVKLAPGGVRTISLNDEIERLRGSGTDIGDFGSISVRYSAPHNGVILPGVQNVDPVQSLSFISSFNEAVPESKATEHQVLRGMWWRLDDKCQAYIALTNNSKQTIQVVVSASRASGARISLVPHQTRFLKNWNGLNNAPGRTGSLDIAYQGAVDALSVDAGTYDEQRGFSTRMSFYSMSKMGPPSKTSTRTFVSPGMMVGAPEPMMMFPSGTVFHAYAFVRNVGAAPILLRPALYGVDKSAVPLAPITVPPNAAIELPVDQAVIVAKLTGMVTLALHAAGDPHIA